LRLSASNLAIIDGHETGHQAKEQTAVSHAPSPSSAYSGFEGVLAIWLRPSKSTSRFISYERTDLRIRRLVLQ